MIFKYTFPGPPFKWLKLALKHWHMHTDAILLSDYWGKKNPKQREKKLGNVVKYLKTNLKQIRNSAVELWQSNNSPVSIFRQWHMENT